MQDVFIVNFNPVIFSIGPLSLHWYGLSYAVGIFLAWKIGTLFTNHPYSLIKKKQLDDFVIYGMAGILIGGRIGYMVFYNLSTTLRDPLSIFKIWQGGMSFHGGFIGVILAVIIFSYKKNVSLLALSDFIGSIAPIGLFFGRIANFINGELWGKPSDVPWAVIFPAAGSEPRHPSPLYEALGEGILLALLLQTMLRINLLRNRKGFVAGSFFLFYALVRIFIEFFREPDAHIGFLAFDLTLGQWLSIPMIFIGLGFLIYSFKPVFHDRMR